MHKGEGNNVLLYYHTVVFHRSVMYLSTTLFKIIDVFMTKGYECRWVILRHIFNNKGVFFRQRLCRLTHWVEMFFPNRSTGD